MAPALLPIAIEPFQTKGQNARSQIGIAPALGQHQEPAVVDHKAQPSGALAWRPPDFLLPGFGVRTGSAESNQSHPLAIDFGHITKAWSSQPGTLQIMPLFQQLVEAISLFGGAEADRHLPEQIRFGRGLVVCHHPWFGKNKSECLVVS